MAFPCWISHWPQSLTDCHLPRAGLRPCALNTGSNGAMAFLQVPSSTGCFTAQLQLSWGPPQLSLPAAAAEDKGLQSYISSRLLARTRSGKGPDGNPLSKQPEYARAAVTAGVEQSCSKLQQEFHSSIISPWSQLLTTSEPSDSGKR